MDIQMKAKHFTPSENQINYATKKLSKFDKLINQELEAQVSCSRIKDQERVEITIIASGYRLRAEMVAPDFYIAFDAAVDILERQLNKYKTRWNNKRKSGESIRTGAWLPEEGAEAEKDAEDPEIIRVKRFALKPISPEEAVMEMEMLDHTFYMFLNALTDEVNVVYRRNDGKYGLIEPELN
ncbi:MAG TPA: ribosome-associated translation inhibitor RaiA [Bacillota bacterium]|nr:ribosome-associated translation inhibitor RaiA [Bacillota bacterium]